MRELSYASDSDGDADRRPRGYAAALVSTSLGSESSFRMPSPVRLPTAPHKTRFEPKCSRGRVAKDPPPDSSLDELIDSFRASASSLKFSNARDVVRTASPVKKTRPTSHEPSKQAPPSKPKSILRTNTRPRVAASGSDEEVVGLSPMPKLTNVPKPKPSLSMVAPPKPHPASHIKPPSKLQTPQNTFSTGAGQKTNRSKLMSPRKFASQDRARSKSSTPPYISPQPSSPTSDLSTTSSAIEEIEAPDSDDAGEMYVDDLISRDLRQLQRLVSSSHDHLALPNSQLTNRSLTSEDIQRSFQRSTRFRVDGDGEDASSFRLFSPHDRTSSASPFHLEPVQSILHRHRTDDRLSPQEDDYFVDELRTMKSAFLKDKERKRNAEVDAKKKLEDEEKQKAADGPGAKITSLREAVDAIDKNLLLALRPFEKMKQEQDKEDADAAAAEEKSVALLELPMATQALVEQLEQAFGGLTRQRDADLKAEEDAAAQAKALEDAKKKDADEKKALEEANRKEEEEKILSLLPMRGKLMNTESDIYKALTRLEVAETLARNSVRHRSSDRDSSTPVQDLASLREFANRRAREIEDLMCAPATHQLGEPRTVDWHRSTFHNDAHDHDERVGEVSDIPVAPEGDSYSDIVQSEVVQKLDFTILKLRHALSIDQKEDAETAARKREIDAETTARENKKSEEKSKLEKIETDSAAARQRVMGVSSIQELPWVAETDTRLRESAHEDLALQRLQSSVDTRNSEFSSHALPSFFDDQLAADRFERLRMMMGTPQRVPVYKAHFTYPSTNQKVHPVQRSRLHSEESSRWSPGRYERHAQAFNIDGEQSNRVRPQRNFDDIASRMSFASPRSNNQVDDRQSAFDWKEPLRNMKAEIGQRKSARNPTKYSHSQQKEKTVDMKRAIYELQANRREKAHWFHNSSRSR